MTLAALIDLGADMEYILSELRKLPIDPFIMDVKQIEKKGISSKSLVLHFTEEEHKHFHHHTTPTPSHSADNHTHHHRHASAILKMIRESDLSDRVKERSLSVFDVIAKAEGKIHGMDPAAVHFHEVGAMDSIIDVIGVALALESLDVDKIVASPVPTGHGKVMMAHGLYPIPAPATAEILTGVPLADFSVEGELTTPTGAGFIKALVSEYGSMPAMQIEKIGYGAGKKDFDHPNVLRVMLFETKENYSTETITVVECQLDDMPGEAFGYLMEEALDKGALDLYYTPITMKKSRPGILITVLCKPESAFIMEDLLLRETTTFGVRKSKWERHILLRRFQKVETPYGTLTVKIGFKNGEIYKISPEYEEIKKVARKHFVPFMEVYRLVENIATEQITK